MVSPVKSVSSTNTNGRGGSGRGCFNSGRSVSSSDQGRGGRSTNGRGGGGRGRFNSGRSVSSSDQGRGGRGGGGRLGESGRSIVSSTSTNTNGRGGGRGGEGPSAFGGSVSSSDQGRGGRGGGGRLGDSGRSFVSSTSNTKGRGGYGCGGERHGDGPLNIGRTQSSKNAAAAMSSAVNAGDSATKRLEELSYRELQAECKKAGMPATGKAAVLLQRLAGGSGSSEMPIQVQKNPIEGEKKDVPLIPYTMAA